MVGFDFTLFWKKAWQKTFGILDKNQGINLVRNKYKKINMKCCSSFCRTKKIQATEETALKKRSVSTSDREKKWTSLAKKGFPNSSPEK
ncbi:MAG: hypothetical protein H6680_07280 [Desulfobacteraceae bacterium]|nr:hypothetical protein [Desulfobacteraceae bacterium]